MSAGRTSQIMDQFQCSICLDVFIDPVSTPCGHNFCKQCIDRHWDSNVLFNCPMCKEHFPIRPQLRINTFIQNLIAQISRCEQQPIQPGDVPCDICGETKLKAVKSCLVCLASYCETHLEPHLTAMRLKRHQLTEPVEDLEERICAQHSKLLELFCRTDNTCICSLCSVLDHKSHGFVPLSEECDKKKVELGKTEAGIQHLIQTKQEKIQEIEKSVRISKEAAGKEKAEGVRVFTALKRSVEKGLEKLMTEIEDKQNTAEKLAEVVIKDLKRQISELMQRSSEAKQLLCCEDHLHFIQRFSSLNVAPPTREWEHADVKPLSYDRTVVNAVAQLGGDLGTKMITFQLNWVQQYAVDVTLDPDTAHPRLVLSNEGKRVSHGDSKKNLPDNPDRFSYSVCVLGKQSFSSGRFYFEVRVEGKTEWDFGVARESVNRKGDLIACPQHGYYTISLRNGSEYTAGSVPSIRLCPQPGPERVGVFVDYDQGLVSFYNVEPGALIYSFTGCCFTEKLYPFFSPCKNDGGKNSGPLVICPVNPTTVDFFKFGR